jgi:DNA-binding transcriptional MocR family regulator
MMHAYTRPGALSAAQAAEIAYRARKLLRAGRITHHAYAVLDALLWGSRQKGADSAAVSYSRLQQLAHVARATVAKAIAQLEATGLLQRQKRRVLVLWANGGRAWRQLPNVYRLLAGNREFTARPEIQSTKIQALAEPPIAAVKAAREALNKRREAVLRTMLPLGLESC